jgi:hypothetical protein
MLEKDRLLYEKAIEWLKRKGYSSVKVNIEAEEFEKPTSFAQAGNGQDNGQDNAMTPDLTAVMRGSRHYFEIAVKADDQQEVVTKWKLLERLASMKESRFYLFTPQGHRAFANRLIKQYNINAVLIDL